MVAPVTADRPRMVRLCVRQAVEWKASRCEGRTSDWYVGESCEYESVMVGGMITNACNPIYLQHAA